MRRKAHCERYVAQIVMACAQKYARLRYPSIDEITMRAFSHCGLEGSGKKTFG
jgi:hypothetical protein